MTSAKLSAPKLQEAMCKQVNIRNISVIAHVDHGKSTLTDALVSRAGIIPEFQAGTRRFTDNREDEAERGITIKSTGVSMLFQMPESEELARLNKQGDEFLVNLVDTPGHVDFSSEVTAALRISDGALVIVDVVSGCSNQTETVLRQALSERIKPVLVINKLDRAILEQQLEPEVLYQKLNKIIADVNNLISVYSENESELSEASSSAILKSDSFKCDLLDPTKGNVAFASGRDGWAFTLTQLSKLYQRKKQKCFAGFINKLWGENYFNPTEKKWQSTSRDLANGETLVRGFNQYVLDPIYKVLTNENSLKDLEQLSTKLEFKFKLNDHEMKLPKLNKLFMKKWLPAAEALLELIVYHLPSPVSAQSYRVSRLYEGPSDDESAIAIRECDSEGCLMMYISKMIPDQNDKSKFLAFGRVFSGCVRPGLSVRIMGLGYQVGAVNELFVKNVTRCLTMIGNQVVSLDEVPAGNIIALSGIDKFLAKSGTISTNPLAHCIKTMKFTVSAVVRYAVEPVNPSDLVKFIEGLKKLCRSDPLVQCEADNGQHIIAGAGELHLEVCLKDLEKKYACVPIRVSEPLVKYKETVSIKSEQICLAKSSNKHNRIYLTAEPLSEHFCNDIEEKKIFLNQDLKERSRYLVDEHQFNITEAKKIWCFGPNHFDSNILVDVTKGVASSGSVTDSICAGFQWGAEQGILCGEKLRGVRFNLEDLLYHSDPMHTKVNQMIPTIRRSMMSSMLTARPILMEPVFLVEIQCTEDVLGPVHRLLSKKRGEIIEEMKINGTQLMNVRVHMPVNESTGFDAELRGVSSGKAYPQCTFDHWQVLPGDPFNPDSKAGQVCKSIRKIKNMDERMPRLVDYLDKL